MEGLRLECKADGYAYPSILCYDIQMPHSFDKEVLASDSVNITCVWTTINEVGEATGTTSAEAYTAAVDEAMRGIFDGDYGINFGDEYGTNYQPTPQCATINDGGVYQMLSPLNPEQQLPEVQPDAPNPDLWEDPPYDEWVETPDPTDAILAPPYRTMKIRIWITAGTRFRRNVTYSVSNLHPDNCVP